jgi:peptide deformylase
MLRLMVEHDGLGLAAPQVGLPLRLILISPCATGDHRHTLVLANPVLLGESAVEPMLGQPGVELGPEGCLSVDAGEREGLVPRWREVRCAAQTLDGEPVEVSAVGLGARVLQHVRVQSQSASCLVDASRDTPNSAMPKFELYYARWIFSTDCLRSQEIDHLNGVLFIDKMVETKEDPEEEEEKDDGGILPPLPSFR